jgi:YD repeat-containing protein
VADSALKKLKVGLSLNFCTLALLFLCSFALLIFSVSPASAETVNYIYDDLGRLIRVTDENNQRVLYQYDKVGNLMSITTEDSAAQALPPVLEGIDPDIFIVGEDYNVAITGQNLLTTSSITTDNSNITIRSFAAIDKQINMHLSIENSASSGQANLTVTTSYGSASMAINLYKLVITPDTLGLFPSQTGSMSVSLSPSASEDLEVEIINNNPGIIETQSSVIIPAGAGISFTVKALKAGMGTINIGDTEAMVYVYENGTLMNAMPVSVYIESSVDATTVSSPASVKVEQLTPVEATIATMPVSVEISSSEVSGTTSSDTVSVEVLSNVNGTVASDTVSVKKQ